MKQNSKTGLLLMELIFAILIFSLCSTICVQLFVEAHQTEQRAADLSRATLLCDSTAAMIQSGVSSPDMEPAFYDSAFRPCGAADAKWQLTVSDCTSEDVPCAHIRVTSYAADPAASDADAPFVLYEIHAGY